MVSIFRRIFPAQASSDIELERMDIDNINPSPPEQPPQPGPSPPAAAFSRLRFTPSTSEWTPIPVRHSTGIVPLPRTREDHQHFLPIELEMQHESQLGDVEELLSSSPILHPIALPRNDGSIPESLHMHFPSTKLQRDASEFFQAIPESDLLPAVNLGPRDGATSGLFGDVHNSLCRTAEQGDSSNKRQRLLTNPPRSDSRHRKHIEQTIRNRLNIEFEQREKIFMKNQRIAYEESIEVMSGKAQKDLEHYLAKTNEDWLHKLEEANKTAKERIRHAQEKIQGSKYAMQQAQKEQQKLVKEVERLKEEQRLKEERWLEEVQRLNKEQENSVCSQVPDFPPNGPDTPQDLEDEIEPEDRHFPAYVFTDRKGKGKEVAHKDRMSKRSPSSQATGCTNYSAINRRDEPLASSSRLPMPPSKGTDVPNMPWGSDIRHSLTGSDLVHASERARDHNIASSSKRNVTGQPGVRMPSRTELKPKAVLEIKGHHYLQNGEDISSMVIQEGTNQTTMRNSAGSSWRAASEDEIPPNVSEAQPRPLSFNVINANACWSKMGDRVDSEMELSDTDECESRHQYFPSPSPSKVPPPHRHAQLSGGNGPSIKIEMGQPHQQRTPRTTQNKAYSTRPRTQMRTATQRREDGHNRDSDADDETDLNNYEQSRPRRSGGVFRQTRLRGSNPNRGNALTDVRCVMNQLMHMSRDDDIIRVDVASADEVQWFERGQGDGPTEDDFRPYFGDKYWTKEWHATLQNIFISCLQDNGFELDGNGEKGVLKMFDDRIGRLRRNRLNQEAKTNEALEYDKQRRARATRASSRRIKLYDMRRECCLSNLKNQDGTINEGWRASLELVRTLGGQGMSSDESSWEGEGESRRRVYCVKKRKWRSNEVQQRLELIDTNAKRTNAFGGRRAGNAPRIRIRMRSGPESTRDPVVGCPRNFYNTEYVSNLTNMRHNALDIREPMDLGYVQVM